MEFWEGNDWNLQKVNPLVNCSQQKCLHFGYDDHYHSMSYASLSLQFKKLPIMLPSKIFEVIAAKTENLVCLFARK